MFKEDVKRIKACIEYKDYYAALEYAIIVKDKYVDNEKDYFEKVIRNVKSADYNKIWSSTNYDRQNQHNIV